MSAYTQSFILGIEGPSFKSCRSRCIPYIRSPDLIPVSVFACSVLSIILFSDQDLFMGLSLQSAKGVEKTLPTEFLNIGDDTQILP